LLDMRPLSSPEYLNFWTYLAGGDYAATGETLLVSKINVKLKGVKNPAQMLRICVW
jgi:hypothetical protein